MKLQHIPLGGRFEYEGRIFTKTGPLTAASEEGGQQIIPRYAVLKPLNAPDASSSADAKRPDSRAVRAAFDRFYRAIQPLVPDTSQTDLEAARRQFLSTLG